MRRRACAALLCATLAAAAALSTPDRTLARGIAVGAQPPPGSAPPAAVRMTRTYKLLGSRRLRVDIYLPRSEGRHPAIVFVHGGGWHTGHRGAYTQSVPVSEVADDLARRGYAVFSIGYRLAPAALFPAAPNDVDDAIRWVRANAGRFAIDPRRIALMGNSAGGNLAALVGARAAGSWTTGARVRAVVSYSGPMQLDDLEAIFAPRPGVSIIETYLGCKPRECPHRYLSASPTTHLDASDPPMLIVNGSEEIIPLSQAQTMTAALASAGIPHRLLVIPGTRHAGTYRSEAWPQTLAFLADHL